VYNCIIWFLILFSSILFLIIGILNKSNFQEASKGVKVIEQHPKLKTVLFQLMLDILLIPYKWTSPNEVSVPGLNVQSLNRLRTNIPLIFTDADYHEQVIYLIFPFLYLNFNI